VYISSTFKDMSDWRRIVRDRLLGLKQHPIDLSLEVGRHQLTSDLIDEALHRADRFVGILGQRYGSRVNNVASAISWTQYEYKRFLMLSEAEDPPCRCRGGRDGRVAGACPRGGPRGAAGL
jgi:hypothetical protein